MRKIILQLAAILLFAAARAQKDSTPIKLINYNVLHGFNNDSILENKFVQWAIRQDADIFTFQELNGFDQERLEKLAAKYHHPYVAINAGPTVTHPVGITSKYPIVFIHKVVENMWHSLLYGNIKGVHVFVTHLSPFDVQSRRNDVELILAHALQLPPNEKVLITGDFNSLALIDAANYDSSLIKNMRKQEGRLEPKSGLPIVKGKTIYRHNMDNGQIDYTVTGKVLEKGFYDSYYIINKKFKNSVPTKPNIERNSTLRRIDYIWVNKTLQQKVIAADIIQDAVTDSLSDHYPVMIEFNLK